MAIHYDEILACTDEEDLTIRLKALELVEKLTDRSNCKDIVGRLIEQISPSSSSKKVVQPGTRSAAGALRAISSSYDTSSPSGLANEPMSSEPSAALSTFAVSNYRYRLLLLILRLTSRSSEDGSQLYVNITNFEWFIDTLFKVAYLALSVIPSIGPLDARRLAAKLSDCLLDVTARAMPIREFAVKRCKRVMADDGFLSSDNMISTTTISACSYIIGEYGPPVEGKDAAHVMLERYTTAPSPDILLGAMQSMTKWLDYRIENWSESDLPAIRQSLQSFVDSLGNLPGQEAFLHCALINLVLSGLNGPRLPASPRSEKGNTDGQNNEEAIPMEHSNEDNEDPSHNPFASSTESGEPKNTSTETSTGGREDQGAPVSLTLLRSVFTPYELKPLAPNAQSLVAPPPGVNLDAWIGTAPSVLPEGGRKKRSKITNSPQNSTDVDEYGRPRASTSRLGDADTSVSMSYSTSGARADALKKSKKSKKDGVAGEVTGERSKKKKSSKTKDGKLAFGNGEAEDDVDAIPIVKLDLGGEDGDKLDDGMKVVKKGKAKEKDNRDSERRKPRTPSPPPLVLSAGGDMPSVRGVGGGGSAGAGGGTRSRSDIPSSPGGKTERGEGYKDVRALPSSDASVKDPQDRDTSVVLEDKAAVKVVKKKKKKATSSKKEEGLI